jgi:demethylmenaquinone methyltransferase / 2-methoxy-6-polyprenyl-1,4-benzoquinol methylase
MAVTTAAERAQAVSTMFTRIARRYDLMNSVMTAGRHHAWREAAAREAIASPPGPVLDLATGTADLAIAARRLDPSRVVIGADFSLGMLGQARLKLGRDRAGGRLALAAADALALPFPDGAFAGVVSAFLVRNLVDLEAGLAEMRRVTRRGGRVITLDIVKIALPVWGELFGLYFHRVVPAIGALVAGDRQAYTYLPDSVDRFLSARELAAAMRRTGLRDVGFRTFGLGSVALHVGIV